MPASSKKRSRAEPVLKAHPAQALVNGEKVDKLSALSVEDKEQKEGIGKTGGVDGYKGSRVSSTEKEGSAQQEQLRFSLQFYVVSEKLAVINAKNFRVSLV